jgi:hypothetical protein
LNADPCEPEQVAAWRSHAVLRRFSARLRHGPHYATSGPPRAIRRGPRPAGIVPRPAGDGMDPRSAGPPTGPVPAYCGREQDLTRGSWPQPAPPTAQPLGSISAKVESMPISWATRSCMNAPVR